MRNSPFNPILLKVLMILLFVHGSPAPVHAIDFFGPDDEVLWQSGINFFIKFVEQNKTRSGQTPPNQHPIVLNSTQVTNALYMLEFWDKKGFFSREESNNKVFTQSQARLLGFHLSKGLERAKPDEDIAFQLSGLKKLGALGLKERAYMSGRAFYLDNRLHIIIGDYDHPGDKGKEAVYDKNGTQLQYFFNLGRRSKASGFDKNIVTGNGIDVYTDDNKRRPDWLMIDIDNAAAAYVARKDRKGDDKKSSVDSEEARVQAEKLARERREMRVEMARMRKEMKEITNGNNGTSDKTVEERIKTLDELLAKELITKDEYDSRREEILNEI